MKRTREEREEREGEMDGRGEQLFQSVSLSNFPLPPAFSILLVRLPRPEGPRWSSRLSTSGIVPAEAGFVSGLPFGFCFPFLPFSHL